MDTLPICRAKSKQSGHRCGNFCVKGKQVCHIHGGKSTGARTVSGRHRQKMASWEHGRRSKEAIAEARAFRKMLKEGKELLTSLY